MTESLSPRSHGFSARPAAMEFLLDKVALARIFLAVLRYFPRQNFTSSAWQFIHTQLNPLITSLNKTIETVLPLIEQALRPSQLEFDGSYYFKLGYLLENFNFSVILTRLTEAHKELQLRRLKDIIISWPSVQIRIFRNHVKTQFELQLS